MSTSSKVYHPDGTVSFTLPNGTTFVLQQISALALQTIQSSTRGRPAVPIVEIVRHKPNGQEVRLQEPNPDDPAYREALLLWQQEKQISIMQYCICRGVLNSPPAGYADSAAPYLQSDDPELVKFFWVVEQIKNERDIEELAEAIASLTIPTAQGLEQAEDRFRGDDQRDGREEIRLQAPIESSPHSAL